MTIAGGDPISDVAKRLAERYDPYDPELTGERTFEVYKRMLEQEELIWTDTNGGFAVAAKYDDVHEIERCPEIFSSAQGTRLFNHSDVGAIPLEYDAPIHTEYRKLYLEVLNRKAVELREPYTRAQAEALFERLAGSGGGNVMTDVALPLTFNVMAEFMGASASFRKGAPELFQTFGVNMANEEGMRAMLAIHELLGKELEAVRSEPGVGFLQVLIDARVEGGRPLSQEEMQNALLTFGFAGFDTTMSLMGTITVLMGRDRELQEKLRSDNSLIPDALEEALRLYPSGHSQCRTVAAPTELSGRALQPGDKVMLILAAANRDPRKFDNPEDFELHRSNSKQHLSFGFGAHLCAGNHLARAESRIFTETLLNRCPPYGFDEEVAFGPIRAGHLLGWDEVPVKFAS